MTEPQHPLYDMKERSHRLAIPSDASETPDDIGEEKPRGIPIIFPGIAGRVPRLTQALLLLNVIIFLPRYVIGDYFEQSFLFGAILPDFVLQNGEVYRLFTAMFLHFSEMHILFNGIALFSIGGNVERIFGHTRFLLIYLLGGLAGSVLSLLLSSSNVIAAGASGAVFAIWGADLMFSWRHRAYFGEQFKASIQTSLLMLGLNIGAGFASPAIGIWAHLGGLFGGIILTWWLGPRFALPNPIRLIEGRIHAIDMQPLKKSLPVLVIYSVGLLLVLGLTFLLRA
jgi:rhomboid protease GluP